MRFEDVMIQQLYQNTKFLYERCQSKSARCD
jgi:hypothetical protein